ELPSQWRGFLLDQRTLRTIALKSAPGTPPNPTRARYEQFVADLEKTSRQRKLSADEIADLGGLHVRLGGASKAVDLLRAGQRDHPNHFRIAANLGIAWQMQGDLDQAAIALEQAVRLAPGKWQKFEDYHLKLVRSRQRERRENQDLDDLFGVCYVADSG